MNAQWLKAKTAGMPRWAWLLLLAGAVGAGLYIRSRPEAESTPEEEEEINPEETGLNAYEGTETAGGLGSVGIAGPAGGTVVPVEAPFIPDGFTDLLTSQGMANVEAQQGIMNLATAALEREPGERVEVIREPAPVESRQGEGRGKNKKHTGGGAPKRKPHHKAPKKPKAKKPPKPKQNRPPKNHPKGKPPKKKAGHSAR